LNIIVHSKFSKAEEDNFFLLNSKILLPKTSTIKFPSFNPENCSPYFYFPYDFTSFIN